MTGRELVALLGSNPLLLWLVLALPPLVALAAGVLHGVGNGARGGWKYLYSAIVYATCIPGMFAVVLTGYALFLSRDSLLDVNLLVYIAPILAMVATLMIVRRNVPFDRVPGFDRLSGLMTMIAMTFVVVLAVSKTRIFLFFGGSIGVLIAMAAFVFALLKWGAYMAFRGPRDPKRDRPRLGID